MIDKHIYRHQMARIATPLWWSLVVILILFKMALVADLPVHIAFFPHDDSLYVVRAYHLLHGEAFGPYNTQTLAKLPGISFFLTGLRSLGVPYLIALNMLYIAAGIYLSMALRKIGCHRWVILFAFAIYLLNPVTMGEEWTRLLREPLSTCLVILMLGATAYFLCNKIEWPHAIVFSVSFAASLLLREEDRLLWIWLALLLGAVGWIQLRSGERLRTVGIRMAMLSVLPVVLALAGVNASRHYVEEHYGLPILYEQGEGEFPKLMAAMRGIESSTDNRLVMLPQETLQKLRVLVPEFAPTVDNIPPVGPRTFSCQLQGVCSEWSNGWMPFWVKDAAGNAGLTPDLMAAQKYFKSVREKIETLCKEGKLKCENKGAGLLPPMEPRWTRAYLLEFSKLIGMVLFPDPHTIVAPPSEFNVPVALGRVFRIVTMTDAFDTLAQKNPLSEARPLGFENPSASLRVSISQGVRLVGGLLLLLAAIAIVWRVAIYPLAPLSPLFWLAATFIFYSIARLLALSWVAVFFGSFDPRIIFSTYTGMLILAPLIMWDCVVARRTHLMARN